MANIYGKTRQEKIDYQKIADLKIEEYGTKLDNYIGIIINQYKDRTHFIFELLQNAEDAYASKVDLHLYRDRFEIIHNGILFQKSDVVAITEIADSSKKDGSIGRFGIGFKSVYAYTQSPRIYSGIYSFAINKFVHPVEIKSDKSLDKNLTKIVIPFVHEQITASQAYAEISRALKNQIGSDTILFLKSIQHVHIEVEGDSGSIDIIKKSKDLHGSALFSAETVTLDYKGNLAGVREKGKTVKQYLMFGDMKNNEVNLAYVVDGKNLVKIKETNIYTFFPTDKESHQSFYIHAPFATTPARDNIIEDNPVNADLVDNICHLLRHSIMWLRDNGYFTIEGMNAVYPVYEYSEDTIFRSIYDTAVGLIAAGQSIIPTEDFGRYEKISNICFPEAGIITEVFTNDDIHSLIGPTKCWIAKEIVLDNYTQLRAFLRNNFKNVIRTLSWKSLTEKLDGRFLERKKIDWYTRLFKNIRNISVITRTEGSHQINVSPIPFIRLSNGKNITAFSDGLPNVYSNNPDHCKNKIHEDFLNNEIVRNYYVYILRVPEYDLARIISDEILPKYDSKDIRFATKNHFKENCDDLKQLKKAINIRRDINFYHLIKDKYIVTDGEKWFKPGELHIPEEYMQNGIATGYDLVSGLMELDYLDTRYLGDPNLDLDFFCEIGCSKGLRKIQIDNHNYLELLGRLIGSQEEKKFRETILQKKYREGFNYSQTYEGFPELLQVKEFDIAKSCKVAAFLNRRANEIDIEGRVRASNSKRMDGNSTGFMDVPSALGIVIHYVPWIYDKSGNKCTVKSICKSDADPLYEKKYPKLFKILEFKEEDKDLEAFLSRFQPEEQKALKVLMSNPDFLKKTVKMIERQSKPRRGTQSLNEAFNELEGNTMPGSLPGELPEVNSIKNLKRREEKLEEEFKKTLDYQTTMKGTRIYYTCRNRVSKEEKQFLESEYHGVCQICQTAIMRYDGMPYFEAINMLNTKNLEDAVKSNIENGWNSLCLCPNCAAKYRFGRKDLSEFRDKIMTSVIEEGNDEYIKIDIGLQDRRENIRYSPRHMLSLKKAIDFYNRSRNNEDDDD